MKVNSLKELKQVRQRLAEERARAAEEAAAREAAARRARAEQELFSRAIGPTQPLRAHGRVVHAPQPAPPEPRQRQRDEQNVLRESISDEFDASTLLQVDEHLSFRRPGIGPDVLPKLRRGHWSVQGQIDLHGLTRDEARAALADFLHDALAQGKRCIRVIHGKGHGSPGKVSILKQLSRGWLAQREEILAFCQAGPHDGGGGALLVLLRAQNAAPRA